MCLCWDTACILIHKVTDSQTGRNPRPQFLTHWSNMKLPDQCLICFDGICIMLTSVSGQLLCGVSSPCAKAVPFLFLLCSLLNAHYAYLLCQCLSLIIPPHNEVVGGVYWFHTVSPSVHLSIRLSVPHSVSALHHLQFWLDPFDIYTSYQATSECVSRVKLLAKFQNLNSWQFFKLCNFDFVLFWLGIWCESLVLVIMRWRGYLRTQAF